MAVDAFLKLEGPQVEGESKVKGFEGQIQILDVHFGISQPAGGHFGTGSGVGKADFHDLSVTKRFDLSSPTLMGFCANGKPFDKGTITLRKVSGDKTPMTWLTVEMNHVLISALHPSGIGGGEGLENMTLNFDKIKMAYTSQKEDGTKDKTKEFVFSPREVEGGPN
jgi:type VI secretion system secreted protein Hcp